MEENKTTPSSGYFFAIDIGTRFVRGLICESSSNDGKLRILECDILEHETRAMRAGQIHDIEKVAAITARIKESLEKKLSSGRYQKPGEAAVSLKNVAIAVAGRNLVTYRGRAEIKRPMVQPVTAEDIQQIELAAVQHALENVNTEEEYYCVGYSQAGYWLDGEEIATLLDHRGSVITAEVLVTLLPRQVLEALFAVMNKAGLEIDYLTLEPIAALESTLSPSLRSLDLILVDIGAGTSDIAIVSKGRIKAYGMVQSAGDMITETISGEYLVDFPEAERLKRDTGIAPNIVPQEKRMPDGSIGFGTEENGVRITFRDIFDREYSFNRNEVLAKIRPSVSTLACRIVDEIKKLIPDAFVQGMQHYAIVLVGGGSLTPFLEEELSAAMQLPRQRIGIRPASLNRLTEDETGKLHGPDAATVMGIALLRGRQAGLSLTHLTVNEKRVTAVSSDRNPNILSVLLSNGITVKQIYGRPGMAKTYTLNGQLCTIKGDTPQPATVELNGQKVKLDTPVKEGDKIVFYPAIDGNDAQKTISETLQLPIITFNGKEQHIPADILMNGSAVKPDTSIDDRADIRYSIERSLNRVLELYGIGAGSLGEHEIRVDVNGEDVSLKSKQYRLTVNGADVSDTQLQLSDNDNVVFEPFNPAWKVSDVASVPQPGKDLKVKVNGEEFVFPGGKGKVLRNGAEAAPGDELCDGDIIRSVPGKDAEAVLVDIFRHISVAPQDQAGKRLKLLVDGQESQFTSPLHDNAEIKLLFEDLLQVEKEDHEQKNPGY